MGKDPYRYFRVEARELLDQLCAGALDLEKGRRGADLVARLLRLAHTLKGAAHVVKLGGIADLAHAVEDALAPYRDSSEAVSRECVDAILSRLDAISSHIERLPAAEGGTPAPAAPSIGDPPPRAARSDLEVIDALLEGLGELSNELANMRRIVLSLGRARELAGPIADQLAVARGGAARDGTEASDGREGHFTRRQAPLSKASAMARSAHELLQGAERGLAGSVERFGRELRQARETAERLRLTPVANVFTMLERTAREAARSVGKQVEFSASGGEVRLDGQVLDVVQGALVQLVRNAVAHGIETETERLAAGKPGAGRVWLEVARRGCQVSFRCKDDGRGVDLEAVRRAAQRKGASAADAGRSDASGLMALLLKGGISTSNTVTELAGRGVGLDVVREAAQRLNGEVAANTGAGAGTTVELRVPVSLTAVEALIVDIEGQTAALPLDAVRRTVRIAAADIVRAPEGDAIFDEGRLVRLAAPALAPAHALRPGGERAGPRMLTFVIIATGDTDDALAALPVERLRGTETIVLRPLPALAPADPVVAGAWLDADGNPRIVLAPEALTASAGQRRASVDPRATPARPILIVDDSLTTRMLETSILESAGFLVESAASAEEGLELARRKDYALFLVDIEMPGMDGFSFVERTRADPALCGVPCILVSSRDLPEDRRRGEAAGAVAYIVKGDFDQTDFLQRVGRLVPR